MTEKFIFVVIEEFGIEDEASYNPILVTPSYAIALKKMKELKKNRNHELISKAKWKDMIDYVWRHINEHPEVNYEEIGTAELIYEIIKPKFTLNQLRDVEAFYDNQDPYYDIKIKKTIYIE